MRRISQLIDIYWGGEHSVEYSHIRLRRSQKRSTHIFNYKIIWSKQAPFRRSRSACSSTALSFHSLLIDRFASFLSLSVLHFKKSAPKNQFARMQKKKSCNTSEQKLFPSTTVWCCVACIERLDDVGDCFVGSLFFFFRGFSHFSSSRQPLSREHHLGWKIADLAHTLYQTCSFCY